MPTVVGILVALTILLVSAGATIFFLTKPSDEDLLFKQGLRQLANGQYAFAVKTLDKVMALRPRDARVCLSLARAYVGIDQVDKAWQCISQAQQLGAGVVEDPALASELANYYRQREQYEKAIELLRPLAQAGIHGKKAELADLDALWGDEAIRDGDLTRALRCWEEVRELREGTRYSEAEARLATIYQKLAHKLQAEGNDNEALSYLARLNTIAENASNCERMADIYERRGQLELAIDQLRKAQGLPGKNPNTTKRLAALMSRYGKELLDAGRTDEGYAYLQQARAMDVDNVLPSVTVRDINITVESGTRFPRITGEVWNPGPDAVKFLTLKVELWNPTSERVLWDREQKIIDEFVPPLPAQESRPFDIVAATPVAADGKTEFRLYLDGGLYKSYPIGQKTPAQAAASPVPAATAGEGRLSPMAPGLSPPAALPTGAPETGPPTTARPGVADDEQETPAEHPEDRTLKDLDL